MIDDDIDEQIAATEAELGLVRKTTSSFKFLHSLVNLHSPFTIPKPNISSKSTPQESPEEPDHFRLDLQMADAKAELERVRLEGEHFRYRREQQRQRSQDNLKKKTRALKTNMKRLLKAPDSLTRQIVEQTFDEPSRNRFCLNMEIKTVQAISNMWWMHRQLVLQSEALYDLNELLDFERTTLQEEAHQNRAHALMLTENSPQFETIKLNVEQQCQEAELMIDQQRLEISILKRQQSPQFETIKLDVEQECQEVELIDQQRLEISILKRQQFARMVDANI
jgi:glutaredoxin